MTSSALFLDLEAVELFQFRVCRSGIHRQGVYGVNALLPAEATGGG